MCLPLPFGRAVVVIGPPLFVGKRQAEAGLARIEAALTAACDAADAWAAGSARLVADDDAGVLPAEAE